MIFRRRKNATGTDGPEQPPAGVDAAGVDAAGVDAASAESDEAGGAAAGGATGPGPDDVAEEQDWAALDAGDWRADGPWDSSEVDLEEDADDELPARIDLGSVLLTGVEGMELRLQVLEETQQIVSAMIVIGDSALEVAAFAAPRSGGLWAELRDDMLTQTAEAGGQAALTPGPFGVELQRFLPVTTPDGEQGYQPARTWVVEGPRWLLRGVVYGEAAVTEGVEGPVAPLVEAFKSVVVRRGSEAMAPGDLLPLSMPPQVETSPQPAD